MWVPPCQAEPPALLSQDTAPARSYSPTLWPVLLEVSKRSALISEMRAQVGTCCRYSTGLSAPLGTAADIWLAGIQGRAPGPLAQLAMCQDMLCPGRSLAEPAALVPLDLLWAPGKGRAPRVDTAAQSSLSPHPLNARERASSSPTVSIVLHIVEVNPALPPVLLQQVALGAAQVNPAALWQEQGWERGVPTSPPPAPLVLWRGFTAPWSPIPPHSFEARSPRTLLAGNSHYR